MNQISMFLFLKTIIYIFGFSGKVEFLASEAMGKLTELNTVHYCSDKVPRVPS